MLQCSDDRPHCQHNLCTGSCSECFFLLLAATDLIRPYSASQCQCSAALCVRRGRLAREWRAADRALYGGFFKRISISYPAGSVVNIPEQHRSTLHGILEGQQLSLHSRQALAETFPALQVLCAEAPGWTAVPESFRPLLRKIVKKAAAPGTCEVQRDIQLPSWLSYVLFHACQY